MSVRPLQLLRRDEIGHAVGQAILGPARKLARVAPLQIDHEQLPLARERHPLPRRIDPRVERSFRTGQLAHRPVAHSHPQQCLAGDQ